MMAFSLWDKFFQFFNYLWDKFRGMGDVILSWLGSALSAMIPGVNWSSYTGALSSINYFFPLSELISFCVTLTAAYVMVAIYRLIKSWLPTLSGA